MVVYSSALVETGQAVASPSISPNIGDASLGHAVIVLRTEAMALWYVEAVPPYTGEAAMKRGGWTFPSRPA